MISRSAVFLAHARHLHQRTDVITLYAAHEFINFHSGKQSQGQFWPHTVDANQDAEQCTFLFFREAKQQLCIFTHDEMGMQDDRFAMPGKRKKVFSGTSTSYATP